MATTVVKKEKTYKLTELINYYALCNRSEGKSEKTISWYSANLLRFHNYLKARHLPDSIKNTDIKLLREYVLHLLKRHRFENHPYTPEKAEFLSAASVHGHVRTIRAFFSWLQREGFTETNIAKDLKPPKLVDKVISTLSDEEIFSIFHTFSPSSSSEMRNQTIFMLLIDTGMRIGELINLKMNDMNLPGGLMKVMGKGKKERVVPMGSNAQKALQRYLFRHRPSPAHQAIENVFLSIHGMPLTENSIKLVFTRLASKSGVERLHAHLCRHTFATRYLINGGDVFTLQQILGHSTLEMVRHYANLASSHVALQHQKYSPLDRLNLRKNNN
ncbi:MAG: tyrosine-type recombinase/integrase [Dehalococcoidales bacterium]|nr:tyrosine-type recombinase/integrase [Dehalococcoidales bacterium]